MDVRQKWQEEGLVLEIVDRREQPLSRPTSPERGKAHTDLVTHLQELEAERHQHAKEGGYGRDGECEEDEEGWRACAVKCRGLPNSPPESADLPMRPLPRGLLSAPCTAMPELSVISGSFMALLVHEMT